MDVVIRIGQRWQLAVFHDAKEKAGELAVGTSRAGQVDLKFVVRPLLITTGNFCIIGVGGQIELIYMLYAYMRWIVDTAPQGRICLSANAVL